MRITEFRWTPYTLPFRRPFPTARGALAERRGYLLALRDEEGRRGCGEAAPLPDFGGETPPETERALAAWEQALTGKDIDPSPPSAAAGFDLAGLAAPKAPTARHAVELALLDLAGQRAGLSIARLLHPQASASVPVNATLGGLDAEKAEEEARRAAGEGYGTLKVKVGVGGAAADEERLAAVRQAAGDAVRIRIDANGAWQEEEAAALLRRWARFALEYVEQPLPPEDLEGAARLAAISPVPVAADESVRSAEDARRLLERKAARVLILKPMILGGLTVSLRIARLALERDVPAVVTSTLDGVYGRTGALHLAAAIRALHEETGREGGAPACGLATGGLFSRELIDDPPAPERGQLAVPVGAGLGLPLPSRLAG